MTGDDERLLERTLELAERGRRTGEPEPRRRLRDRARRRGARRGLARAPGRAARRDERAARLPDGAAGATAYVSLEPCSHHGTAAAVCRRADRGGNRARRVRRGRPVAEGGGQGLRALREAGVEVELATGELERRARRQNAAFRVHAVEGRPFVLLKLAASLDGRTATATGESRWISSPESRRLVHEWRASMDAVAVGSGTALADDPSLDARDLEVAAERQPLRVVFDRRGRLSSGPALAAGNTVRVAPAGAPPPPPAGRGARGGDARRGPARAGVARRDVAARRGRGGARRGAAAGGSRGLARAVRRARRARRRWRAACSGRSGSRRSPTRRGCATCGRGPSGPICCSRRSCASFR